MMSNTEKTSLPSDDKLQLLIFGQTLEKSILGKNINDSGTF